MPLKTVKKKKIQKSATTLDVAKPVSSAGTKNTAASKLSTAKRQDTVAKDVAAQKSASPMEKIKQSFSEGVEVGRRNLLKRLMQVKGVDTREIQKLYSTGMMEPEILNDLTLGDLVKATGIGMNFARTVKEIILRSDSDLPIEYEKLEIERLKKETKKINSETENVRKEIEQLNKNYVSMQNEMISELDEKDKLQEVLDKLKDEEKTCYFSEIRLQNELMFILKEQRAVRNEAERLADNFGYSEKELNTIKREFMFTKGECSHILDKINYLVERLDSVLKLRGVSQNKLTLFMSELKRIHKTLVDAYKKANLEYYEGKA